MLTRLGQLREFYDPDTVELMNWIMYVYSGTCYVNIHVQWKSSTLLGISSFFNIEFDIEIFNTLNTSMHAVNSNYKRTEKNGMPLSFVMASYSLQASGSQLV